MTRYSRSAWDARPSRGGPGHLTPSRVEGIAFHWPAMTNPVRGFQSVAAALRGWQDFHMDGRGYSDIAYQVAIDQDGNRYELRGLPTQSGANGDNDVNERFGAALLVLAPGEPISDAMAAEARRVVADHRAIFPNSRRIVGHGDIRPEPTACPGPAANAAIRAGRFDPTTQEDDDMSQYAEQLDRIEENQKKLLTRLAGDAAIRVKLTRLVQQGRADARELREIQALLEDDKEQG